MSEPTKENISLVLRGFEEFYQFMTRTKTIMIRALAISSCNPL